MALVGHISGSYQSQSVIGVTGSVVFANRPTALFPTITSVGSDVVFFVSGTVGGKNVAGQKTVAVFGGDAVVSGSLTVGSGSVKITSNDIQFGGASSRIELNGSDLKFFDATNPSGFTLTSLSSGGGGGADSAASYIVVGLTGSLPNERALTGGTGILTSDAGANGSFTLSINDSVVATVSGSNFTGGVTGTVLSMSGDITAGGGFGNTGVSLSSAGDVRANGFLQVDGLTALTGSVTLAGNSQNVTHTGTGNLTISSAGSVLVEGTTFTTNDVTVAGDLAVNGPNLTTTQPSFALLAGATTSITVGGNSTAISLGTGISSRVNIAGDLFVQGNVTSIESTNTRIKDALLLLGSGSAAGPAASAIAFASGSVTANQALVFGAGIGQDTLTAVKADVQDGGLAISAGTFTNYVPIRAGRFELGGALAFITSSDGTSLSAKGNDVQINAATGNTSFQNNGSTVLEVSGSGVSGASLEFKSGPSTTTANLFSNPGTSITTVNFGKEAGTLSLGKSGGSSTFNGNVTGSNFSVTGQSITTTQSTFNLVNTAATTVNFAGAATLLTMGASSLGSSTSVLNVLTASAGIVVGAGAGTFADIDAGVGKTTANLFNTVATTVRFAGAGTNISVGAGGSGATFLKNAELFVSGTTTFGASVLPATDVSHDLGSPTARWANMYTGDLHLKNDRGDWPIIEESDFLTITNNKNGKRYKFVMEEIG